MKKSRNAYRSEKRKKEIERQKKQESKREQRLHKKEDQEGDDAVTEENSPAEKD